MAAASAFLNQKPLLVGMTHFAKAFLGIGAITVAGAGAIEVTGNPRDVGPRIELDVPHYQPPAQLPANGQVSEITNTEQNPNGVLQAMAWRIPDGSMSPWVQGLQLDSLQEEKTTPHGANANEPHARSVAEAAIAPPAPNSGQARILAPQMDTKTTLVTNNENGVNITRGAVSYASGAPLPSAPISGLTQMAGIGPLPIVSSDGRTPFDAYKRPFAATGAPKIALVVGGLGLNSRITERAINQLPSEVTLSFVPTADNLQGWINKARAKGHEVLIEIPMEPYDYPDNDPGPQTILSSASAEENQHRLEFSLSRATGYFGVTNYLGGKLAGSAGPATSIMKMLKARGLGFVSDGTTNGLGQFAKGAGLKSSNADRLIDQRPSASDINAQLGALEALAGQRGYSIGFGVGYAVTIDQISSWASQAKSRGIVLAPVSAMTN